MTAINQKPPGVAHQISGWIAALVGVICILFGLFVLLGEAGSALPNWYEGVLICMVPSWVVGIPLLVFGVRRITHLDIRNKTEAEIFAGRHRSYLVWSWVDAITGGLLTLNGVTVLYLTMAMIQPSDWIRAYFVFILISLTFGIPILIIGIRRLKKVPEYRDLNWGWIALVSGGLPSAAGIYFLLLYLFVENIGSLAVWLSIIAPLLLVGIPVLIVGVDKIEKVRALSISNPVYQESIENKKRILGWIMTIPGGLTILGSLVFLVYRYDRLFIQAPAQGFEEPYPGYLLGLLVILVLILIMPLFVAGANLLIPGMVLLTRTALTRQAWGWVLLVMAALFLLPVIVAISYEVSQPFTFIGFTAIYASLFLVAGLLCLYFGIRDVHHQEAAPFIPGGADVHLG